MKTLEEMIADLEGRGAYRSTTEVAERVSNQEVTMDTPVDPESSPEFLALLSRAVQTRDAYLDAKARQDETLLELLAYMRRHDISKAEYDGRPITAAPEYEVEYDPALADALKGVLSEKQWEQCFKVETKPIKRGLNKYLRMNGSVADIIRAHQITKKANPKPSAITIGKPKDEDA